MRISFTCTTNKPYTMINTLVFTLKNGTTITVDRDNTDFTNEPADDPRQPGKLTMDWNGCYIWAINEKCVFGPEGCHIYDDEAIEEFKALIHGADVQFELEDDAPDEDYWVTIESLVIS